MPASIFSGTKVRLLKKIMKLNTGAEVHSGTTDPTSSAVDAPIGSLYLHETTGTIYKKNDAGSSTNWSVVGSDAAGVNLMDVLDRDAEVSVGSGLAYDDGAVAAPVDMTGGSPSVVSLSLETNAADVLRGKKSYLIAKTAADAQGEGVAWTASIPKGYRGRTLAFRMPFSLSAAVAENDIRIYAYDVTNSELITPYQVGKILGDQGIAYVTFPVKTSTASIRIGVHFTTTSTTALNLRVDDLSLTSDTVPQGLAGSEWTDYTATITGTTSNPTFGTIVTNKFSYARIGDSIVIRGEFDQSTAGTAGSGTYLFSLPSGLSINTSKLQVGTNFGNAAVGAGELFYNAADAYELNIQAYNSSNLAITAMNTVTGPGFLSSTFLSFANPTRIGFFTNPIPISQWSANVTMAEQSSFLISSYLANGTRVTGAAPTRLGEYRSYLRDANARTYSETNGSPTTAPSANNGIVIYGGNAFTAADTNNEPSKYEIFIGKDKQYKLVGYENTGRTGNLSVEQLSQYGGSDDVGITHSYDPVTGIVSLTGVRVAGGTATQYMGLDETGTLVRDAYVDILVTEKAQVIGVQAPRAYLKLQGANGHGSTNTGCRRFTAAIESNLDGVDYNYVDSSTDGAYVQILRPGMWSFSYSDYTNSASAGWVEITKNAIANFTTAGSGGTAIIAVAGDANYAGLTPNAKASYYFNAGDIVRFQNRNIQFGGDANYTLMTMSRVSD